MRIFLDVENFDLFDGDAVFAAVEFECFGQGRFRRVYIVA